MSKREKQEQSSLPPCPNPDCRQSHVVRNGSHRGRQRSHCRTCKTYFGTTQGTPMYGLKTPAAEMAQALWPRSSFSSTRVPPSSSHTVHVLQRNGKKVMPLSGLVRAGSARPVSRRPRCCGWRECHASDLLRPIPDPH